MELRGKERRIMDLIVFEVGVVPANVRVDRFGVKVVFYEEDLAKKGYEKFDVYKILRPYIPVDLTVNVVSKGKASFNPCSNLIPQDFGS